MLRSRESPYPTATIIVSASIKNDISGRQPIDAALEVGLVTDAISNCMLGYLSLAQRYMLGYLPRKMKKNAV